MPVMTAGGVAEGAVAVVLTMGRPSPFARGFAAVGEVDLYRLAGTWRLAGQPADGAIPGALAGRPASWAAASNRLS